MGEWIPFRKNQKRIQALRAYAFRFVAALPMLPGLLAGGGCAGISYIDGQSVSVNPAVHESSLHRWEETYKERCNVHLHFAGFSYYPADQSAVLDLLEKRGILNRPGSSISLEIFLEQTRITPGWRRIPNAIATVLSGSLIPLVEYFEHRITFRLRDSGKGAHYFRGRTMTHTMVTVLLTPLTPFYWPPNEKRRSLLNATEAFFLSSPLRQCSRAPVPK